MKRFLTILILIFSLQTPSQADDIRDFQLEGISLYDSALDHFSEKQIKNNLQNWYKNKKYSTTSLMNLPQFKIYEELQISFKTGDKNYKIVDISGIQPKNINSCYKELDQVDKELSEMFKNAKKRNKKKYSHSYDKTGDSKITDIFWKFSTGDLILAACYDFSKKMEKEENYTDDFRITIGSEEFDKFLISDPY